MKQIHLNNTWLHWLRIGKSKSTYRSSMGKFDNRLRLKLYLVSVHNLNKISYFQIKDFKVEILFDLFESYDRHRVDTIRKVVLGLLQNYLKTSSRAQMQQIWE